MTAEISPPLFAAVGSASSARSSRPPARRGFTLIELLVVIAIIGVLVGLLMPAVQQARESGRRTQCANNIRQLAIGMQSYHAARKAFPMGVLVTGYQGPGPAGVGYRNVFSWLTYILPYIEQQNVYDRVEFRVFAIGAENLSAGSTVVPAFLCPSDATGIQGGPWAPTNYRGCIGSNGNRFRFNGVFGANRPIGAAHIRDGLSQTLAIGESLLGDFNPATLTDNYIFTRNPAISAENIMSCQSIAPTGSDRGGAWILGSGINALFSADRPPNDRLYDCWAPELGTSNFAARSDHPGGAMAAMADGSVRFFANGIDTAIFRALGTRAGIEVVPGDF